MWWHDIASLGAQVTGDPRIAEGVSPQAEVAEGAVLDTTAGPISIGAGSRVCAGAIIRGPTVIGRDCLVGNNAMVRGPALIGDRVRIGYCVEIKNSRIDDDTQIGPLCFIADSDVEAEVYLGALVRTSNQRLDRKPVDVALGDKKHPTGMPKLGCSIGKGSSLGIQVIVLPGRTIAPNTTYEPRVTVTRNLPAGQYRVVQEIQPV